MPFLRCLDKEVFKKMSTPAFDIYLLVGLICLVMEQMADGIFNKMAFFVFRAKKSINMLLCSRKRHYLCNIEMYNGVCHKLTDVIFFS